MDGHKNLRHARIPRTSRVNDKIIEYYTQFGHGRDLKRFLRLDSPSSSSNKSGSRSRSKSKTRSTTITTSSSCGGLSEDEVQFKALRRLFIVNNPDCESVSGSSQSLPSMELGAVEIEPIEEMQKEHIISIKFECDDSIQPKNNTFREDTVTPEKTPGKQTKQTQTPDSVAKSHKRLEWDSLGDVGYNKSMSTSNISILERSLLRELFHETSSKSNTIANKFQVNNASEGDLKKLQKELFVDNRSKAKMSPERKCSTPPLASSTLVETKMQPPRASGARPKYTTQGTSTSLQMKKHEEKYAQTSLQSRATRESQAVQVNMSLSATPSIAGSSATQSSFEYRGSSASSMDERAVEFNSCPQQNSFVAGISEMLAKRRALSDKNNQSCGRKKRAERNDSLINLQVISDTLTKVLNENKENSAIATDAVKAMPELDLGIQLLCSLIDAKSLTPKEKKKLVRDIVKRITRLGRTVVECEDSADSSTRIASALSSAISSLTDSRNGSSDCSAVQPQTRSFPTAENLLIAKSVDKHQSDSAEGEQLVRVQVYGKNSPPTTSAKALEKLAKKLDADLKQSKTAPKNATNTKNKPYEINKELLIDIQSNADDANTTATDRNTKTNVTSTRCSASSTSTASSSKDLTTQMALNAQSNTTDAETTMNEWLNPLTQSEFEYEQKKRKLAAAAKEQKHRLEQRQKQKMEQPDKEREVQLSWIETEIQRLESLKHLLLIDDSSEIGETGESAKRKQARNKLQVLKEHSNEKLYDTVYSAEPEEEKSSMLSESAERLVQEIEVIIEESNEDCVNFKHNLKRTKERKRETQIFYDKPTAYGGVKDAAGNARFRTMKETVTTNEEQVLPVKVEKETKVSIQRSKIDTPPGSADSESVCSFVQQRKREFMEHYKNKKKTHYEALLQQQQQQLQQQPRSTKAHTSGHYSVPHTMRRTHSMQPHTNFQPLYYQPQLLHYHHQHCLPSSPAGMFPTAPPVPPHVMHGASAGLTSVQSNHNSNTQSSSSMFCVSSEVTIPMGSHVTSSTTTTTHQYDDVAACAIGIQTSDSILRSRPIFGPRQGYSSGARAAVCMWQTTSTSACVQVKPKSIAYVISFDAKTGAPENTSNSITSNSAEDDALTLQDHLQRAKPWFCAQSKERKAILNQIQALRQERERELRYIVDNTSLNSLDRKLNKLPPPPTKHTRIFATKEMKAMTNKHYAKLPEVLNKQEREREERRRRSNRILRDVFNKRLQKRVRNGKLSLNHSRTVI